MILSKDDYTKEQLEKLETLSKDFDTQVKDISDSIEKFEATLELDTKRQVIQHQAEVNRLKSFNGDRDKILGDAIEQTRLIAGVLYSEEDFRPVEGEEDLSGYKEKYKQNVKEFLNEQLQVYFTYFIGKDDQNALDQINQAFDDIVNGKRYQLERLDSKVYIIDKMDAIGYDDYFAYYGHKDLNGQCKVALTEKNGKISQRGKRTIKRVDRHLKGALTNKASKLLHFCIQEISKREGDLKPSVWEGGTNYSLTIDMRAFDRLCHKDMSEKGMYENRRNYLESLQDLRTISFSEVIDGKAKGWGIIADYTESDTKDVFYILFDGMVIDSLRHSPYTYFPTCLYTIDEKDTTTYNLGTELAVHYMMDSNKKRGNHNYLTVGTIIENGQFSEETKKWKERTKGRIETSLDKLISIGELSGWEYCDSKHNPIGKEQLEGMKYQNYKKLVIHYELRDAPDRSQRIKDKDSDKLFAKEISEGIVEAKVK